jgi:hypothetical protein
MRYASGMTTRTKTTRTMTSTTRTRDFVDELFGETLHSKRVRSLSDAVTGALHAASLSIHAIGIALAATAELTQKHAIKQVDRLLSNAGIAVEQLFPYWAAFVLGERKTVRIALDWTDFEKDDQVTLAAYVITDHGRATPLVWKSYLKSSLGGNQTEYEDGFVELLTRVLPEDVHVTLVADRGFASVERYEYLELLGFDYIIRFRGAVQVTDAEGVSKRADEWVPSNGRARRIEQARVTATKCRIPVVVCVKKAKMKESWCLATNLDSMNTAEIVNLYGRRFTIEETFRDVKDMRFGMGLKATSIKRPDRRDRLLLIGALAHAMLTLLGAAGEKLGWDRGLKANTVKRRTLSLYRQGLCWYQSIPAMSEDRLRPLISTFEELLRAQLVFRKVLGVL